MEVSVLAEKGDENNGSILMLMGTGCKLSWTYAVCLLWAGKLSSVGRLFATNAKSLISKTCSIVFKTDPVASEAASCCGSTVIALLVQGWVGLRQAGA